MKISLNVFINYHNLLNNIMINSNPVYKSLYFDFITKYCYTFGDHINSRFRFDYLLDDNEELPENIFIDGALFLNMVKSLENSNLNKKDNKETYAIYKDTTFYSIENQNEKYKLPSYQDKDISLYNYDLKDDDAFMLTIDDTFLGNLRNASMFMCQQGDSERNRKLMGAFIKNGRLLASDTKKVYDFYLGDSYRDLDINANFIKILLLLKANSKLHISKIDNNIKISDDTIDLLITNSLIEIPPVDNPAFIDVYDHESFIVCSKNLALNILSYLSNFLNNCSSTRLNINIVDNTLVFKVIENESSLFIEKSLPVLNIPPDNINNISFYVNINYLKLAINTIPFDNIKMQIANEKIGINISGEEDNNNHIVLVKMVN